MLLFRGFFLTFMCWPVSLQKCVGGSCCISFGRFCRGIPQRIFLGAFAYKHEEKIPAQWRQIQKYNSAHIRSWGNPKPLHLKPGHVEIVFLSARCRVTPLPLACELEVHYRLCKRGISAKLCNTTGLWQNSGGPTKDISKGDIWKWDFAVKCALDMYILTAFSKAIPQEKRLVDTQNPISRGLGPGRNYINPPPPPISGQKAFFRAGGWGCIFWGPPRQEFYTPPPHP